MDKKEKRKIPVYGYITLFITIVLLSGIFGKIGSTFPALKPLEAFDFTNILGKFGVIEAANGITNFKGIGGSGVREAFLLILTLIPSIMLAFGIIGICTVYQGLKAAENLLTPLMKPLLGISGASAIGVVASFTSADAGAGFTNSLYEDNYLTKKQRLTFIAFQFSAPALIVNYYSLGSVLLDKTVLGPMIPLLIIILMKFVGANLCRIYLNVFAKNFDNE